MEIKMALAGNPNCGKTTLFNDLTGSSQYVGNWPGVTVEKKEGRLRGHKEVILTDLPGIYSLSPYTLEEVVTRDYLIEERPDVIINLIDASNMERNLYLTTQLAEMGIPVLAALNMMDIVQKNGDRIDVKRLSEELGCPVMETSAVKGIGLTELAEEAVRMTESGGQVKTKRLFSKPVEQVLDNIEGLICGQVPPESQRWYAVKLFERDEKALLRLNLSAELKEQLEEWISACEKEIEDTSESRIANERYEYIAQIVQKCVKKKQTGMTISDKIDRIVTNRWLALPIFAVVMGFVYFISVSWLGAVVTDWTNDTLFAGIIQPMAAEWLEAAGTSDWLIGLIVDGCIGGVGAVLGFVPQMMILFFFLSILEDCGYMARVAFIMDRIFRKFGLSGKSFIPMLISSGCGVPGIMASRTIENEKDRKMTIMLTTFIPCGAKLPIIALIAGALFHNSGLAALSMYFLGIAAVIFSGIVLKKTPWFSGDPAPFVMELPQYHLPAAKGVWIHMWERGRSFIVKAGTVIFIACGAVWFLSNFGFGPDGFGMVEENVSILAALGSVIAPIFAPLGFGNWQAAVASLTGLVAKENVVSTFGVLFGLGSDIGEEDPALLMSISGMFNAVSATAFMVFNLICAPCFAAIGAIKREMGSWKWTLIAVGYQTALAYALAFMIYQLGSVWFLGAPFGIGAALAVLLAAGMAALLFCPAHTGKKQNLSGFWKKTSA